MAASALILWVMAYPGIPQDASVLLRRTTSFFSDWRCGVSVRRPLIAGLCVPAAIRKLLPRWLTIFGLVLAVVGELSALSLVIPNALFSLFRLQRFPGFLWLIIAGLALPASRSPSSTEAVPRKA